MDFFCLLLSCADIIVMSLLGDEVNLSTFLLLRLVRLFRLTRLLKTLRLPIFKELNLMVMGVISGARVLFWAVVMLVVIVYILALVVNKLIGEEPEFVSVMASASTIFRCFTEGCADYDGRPLQERLRKKYGAPVFLGYSLIYILISMGVFNLIMALFLDNVVNTQAERKQKDLSDTSEEIEILLKESLLRLVLQSKATGVPQDVEEEIKSLDTVFDDRQVRVRSQFDILSAVSPVIYKDQFNVWLEDGAFIKALGTSDIDVNNKAALFEVVDADLGGSLSVLEVFNGLMSLRGPVTKADIISVRLKVRHLIMHIEAALSQPEVG